MTHETLTKKERIQKYGEVFTPERIVKSMCDMLEKENPDEDPFRPSATFLEPTCGDGAFVLEILRRKFSRCRTRKDYTVAISSVWAMELQKQNVEETIRRVQSLCAEHFTPTKKDLETIREHIIQADSLKVMKMMNELNAREGNGNCMTIDQSISYIDQIILDLDIDEDDEAEQKLEALRKARDALEHEKQIVGFVKIVADQISWR